MDMRVLCSVCFPQPFNLPVGLPQHCHAMAAHQAAQCQPPRAKYRHSCCRLDSVYLLACLWKAFFFLFSFFFLFWSVWGAQGSAMAEGPRGQCVDTPERRSARLCPESRSHPTEPAAWPTTSTSCQSHPTEETVLCDTQGGSTSPFFPFYPAGPPEANFLANFPVIFNES